jgi:hypothetical protein
MPARLGGARPVVEPSIVLRTLDDVVHHQSMGEMRVFVGADAVGRIVLAVGRAIDGEGAAAMIEPLDVFPLDLANRSDLNPAIPTPRCFLFRCSHATTVLRELIAMAPIRH